jgi:hypothetical protein
MKYDITFDRVIQAHYHFIWIFSHFSGIMKKSVPFANKRYQNQNFAVTECIIWKSNKICLKGADEYSDFLDKNNICENEIH